MIDVVWEGRTLSIFTEDLFQRGKEVQNVREARASV